MIFVGFANKHGPDVYRMLNPHTRRTTNNRDVIWLNRMYYVTSCVATTKLLPELAIPTNEGVDDDHSDDESQYESTLSEEMREDIVNNDYSEKSSDLESDNGQLNLMRQVTRSGRKYGLPSGWLDARTKRKHATNCKTNTSSHSSSTKLLRLIARN